MRTQICRNFDGFGSFYEDICDLISPQNSTKTARRPLKVANKLCQDVLNMPGHPADMRSGLHGSFGGLLLHKMPPKLPVGRRNLSRNCVMTFLIAQGTQPRCVVISTGVAEAVCCAPKSWRGMDDFEWIFEAISPQNAAKNRRRSMTLARKLCQDVPDTSVRPAAAYNQCSRCF